MIIWLIVLPFRLAGMLLAMLVRAALMTLLLFGLLIAVGWFVTR